MHKEQIVLSRTITTFNVTKTVKGSSEIKDSSFYAEIVDLDPMQKEFRYYQVCYQNFTREYLSGDRLTFSTDGKNINTTGNVNEERKPDAVDKYVQITFFNKMEGYFQWSFCGRSKELVESG